MQCEIAEASHIEDAVGVFVQQRRCGEVLRLWRLRPDRTCYGAIAVVWQSLTCADSFIILLQKCCSKPCRSAAGPIWR